MRKNFAVECTLFSSNLILLYAIIDSQCKQWLNQTLEMKLRFLVLPDTSYTTVNKLYDLFVPQFVLT